MIIHDSRYKISNNLIYRSIVDDLITLRYLNAFNLKEEADRKSLKNELDNFDREYLSSRLKHHDYNDDSIKYFYELRGVKFDEKLLKAKDDELKEEFTFFFENIEDGTLHKPSYFRNSTDKKIKKTLQAINIPNQANSILGAS